MIKKIRFVFCTLLTVLFTFSGASMAYDSLPSVDAETLMQQLTTAEKPFVLDVRQPQEYAKKHINGATLIPLGELPHRLSEVPKDTPVIVYCRSGNRSARAVAYLMDQGYINIHNLTGGMIVWSRSCNNTKGVC